MIFLLPFFLFSSFPFFLFVDDRNPIPLCKDIGTYNSLQKESLISNDVTQTGRKPRFLLSTNENLGWFTVVLCYLLMIIQSGACDGSHYFSGYYI